MKSLKKSNFRQNCVRDHQRIPEKVEKSRETLHLKKDKGTRKTGGMVQKFSENEKF